MKNQKGREEEDAAASWFRPNSHLFRKLAKTEWLEGAGHIGRIKISYFLVSIFTDFHEEEKKILPVWTVFDSASTHSTLIFSSEVLTCFCWSSRMFVLTSGDTVVVEILCRLVNVEEAVAK